MYGQYKSVVDCPKCGYHSTQFDPFCMCSLPLKNNTMKKMEVTYIENHLVMHKITISYDKSWNWKMSDIMKELAKKIGKPNTNLIAYTASYSSSDVVDLNKKVNEFRSEFKYKSTYVRELLDD